MAVTKVGLKQGGTGVTTATAITALLDAVVGDSGSGGTKGLVPAPSSGDAAAAKFLRADGSWSTIDDVPIGANTASSAKFNSLEVVDSNVLIKSAAAAGSSNPFLFCQISGGGAGYPQLRVWPVAAANNSAVAFQSIREGIVDDGPISFQPNGGYFLIGSTTETNSDKFQLTGAATISGGLRVGGTSNTVPSNGLNVAGNMTIGNTGSDTAASLQLYRTNLEWNATSKSTNLTTTGDSTGDDEGALRFRSLWQDTVCAFYIRTPYGADSEKYRTVHRFFADKTILSQPASAKWNYQLKQGVNAFGYDGGFSTSYCTYYRWQEQTKLLQCTNSINTSNIAITSITRSGSTATVTTTSSHGLSTGMVVNVFGCSQTEYNISATITVTGSTTFTYTVSGTPASPATAATNDSIRCAKLLFGGQRLYSYPGHGEYGSPPSSTDQSTYTVTVEDRYKIFENPISGTTVTLPSASSYTGRELVFKTTEDNSVTSDASNVVPLTGGSAGTAILTNTAGKWAKLVSDGTNWIIMEAN